MKHPNYKIALGCWHRLGKATPPPEWMPVQANATRHKASLEMEEEGRSAVLVGLYAKGRGPKEASSSGLASKSE